VTCSVADPLVPGVSARLELFHRPLQPEGSVSPRLKLAPLHAELSLSATVAVKVTAVPAGTHWLWDGETLRVGLAEVHVGPAVVTCTVAPVLLPLWA
jgi:hypothetical protein